MKTRNTMNRQRNRIITCCAALCCTLGASAQQPLPLSLARCREMALSSSEALRQSDNDLRQAELDREIAKTAFLPGIEASATGACVFPDMDMMGMELRMRGTYMAGISLTQPVYTGGKISAGHRLARIGEESAAEQLRMTRMDVLVEADNAYWNCLAVERKTRMMESYLAQMDTVYRQTEAALAAGMATDNDLLRIEARRTDIRYQLQKVRNGADLCRMSLCRVVGVDLGTPIEIVDTTFLLQAPGALSADLDARPELQLLERQVAAGREQIRMARAELLPTVGLSVGYSYYGNIKINGMTDAGGSMVPYTQEFRDGIGLAMLSVKVPIFHWGQGRKKLRKAQYALRNAELGMRKNTLLMSIEVQQAIRNVQDGYRMVQTAEVGVRQAGENLRVMRNRYAASMSPLTDLLDAQSQWQQAASNLIEAQTQYRIYETEYLRSTGTLE